MGRLFLWFFAGIGIAVTLFTMLFVAIMLFYAARSRALQMPILLILHQREGQEAWGTAEITEVLQRRNGFKSVPKFDSDKFPRWMKFIFKPLELYAPEHLTADACRMTIEAGLAQDVGGIFPWDELPVNRSLLPQYRLTDKGRKALDQTRHA